MALIPVHPYKSLSLPRYLLLGIAAGVMAMHLSLVFRIGDSHQSGTFIVCWAAAAYFLKAEGRGKGEVGDEEMRSGGVEEWRSGEDEGWRGAGVEEMNGGGVEEWRVSHSLSPSSP